MSSTSYPCGTTKATIFQELKVSAKNRTDLHLSDTRVVLVPRSYRLF